MNSSSLTLIKNSRIITEKDDFISDILIKNEKIISIEKNISEENNFIVYIMKINEFIINVWSPLLSHMIIL